MSVVASVLSFVPIAQRGNRRLLLGNIGAALVVMLPWIVYATQTVPTRAITPKLSRSSQPD